MGIEEGVSVGISVTSEVVGISVGDFEELTGDAVVTSDGLFVAQEGDEDDSLLGGVDESRGLFVGIVLGLDVGGFDGNMDGSFVGSILGCDEGKSEGFIVGDCVGAADGEGVGG